MKIATFQLNMKRYVFPIFNYIILYLLIMNNRFKNPISTKLSTNNFIHVKTKSSSKVKFSSPSLNTCKERPTQVDFGHLSIIDNFNFETSQSYNDKNNINDLVTSIVEDSTTKSVNKKNLNKTQDPNTYHKDDTIDTSPVKNKTFTVEKRKHQRFNSQVLVIQENSWALDILENASSNIKNQEVKYNPKPKTKNVNTLISSLFGSCSLNEG